MSASRANTVLQRLSAPHMLFSFILFQRHKFIIIVSHLPSSTAYHYLQINKDPRGRFHVSLCDNRNPEDKKTHLKCKLLPLFLRRWYVSRHGRELVFHGWRTVILNFSHMLLRTHEAHTMPAYSFLPVLTEMSHGSWSRHCQSVYHRWGNSGYSHLGVCCVRHPLAVRTY